MGCLSHKFVMISVTPRMENGLQRAMSNSKLIQIQVVMLIMMMSLITAGNCQTCGPPSVPLNAKMRTINGETGIVEAHYTCDAGYELFGSATIKCDAHTGWERDLPFCGVNVAFRKPVNQSSYTRSGPASYANDGKPGNKNPDGQECSETQKEPSPWWRVDLLVPQAVYVVRITTRGCCGHQPLQDLEIRVGNSSADLQRNPLCAWYPGTLDEGVVKTFTCARPLVGQYVVIQLVGVEGSLSLCEVETYTNDEFSVDRCLSHKIGVDTVVTTFSKICYDFHITKGENFEKARAICKQTGGDLVHEFRGAKSQYILSELERQKSVLKPQLVWIGAQKEPGITSRTWKWVSVNMRESKYADQAIKTDAAVTKLHADPNTCVLVPSNQRGNVHKTQSQHSAAGSAAMHGLCTDAAAGHKLCRFRQYYVILL